MGNMIPNDNSDTLITTSAKSRTTSKDQPEFPNQVEATSGQNPLFRGHHSDIKRLNAVAENEITSSSTPGATLETFNDVQSKVLPHKKLMVVFPAIACAQFLSYLDQTSVSTALPAIASGLNTGASISWVAASFLIASTSIQLINGRLSDIFGRKALLLGSLGLLGLGNLLSGFSNSSAMLFAFRAVSGLGGGAM